MLSSHAVAFSRVTFPSTLQTTIMANNFNKRTIKLLGDSSTVNRDPEFRHEVMMDCGSSRRKVSVKLKEGDGVNITSLTALALNV
jgi:hypothetical protein